MKLTMERKAEVERDRREKVIKSEGELQAAAKFVDAAKMIETAPAALQLRFLQTMSEVANEHTSYVLMPIPMDFLEAFQSTNKGPSIVPVKKPDDIAPEEEA